MRQRLTARAGAVFFTPAVKDRVCSSFSALLSFILMCNCVICATNAGGYLFLCDRLGKWRSLGSRPVPAEFFFFACSLYVDSLRLFVTLKLFSL